MGGESAESGCGFGVGEGCATEASEGSSSWLGWSDCIGSSSVTGCDVDVGGFGFGDGGFGEGCGDGGCGEGSGDGEGGVGLVDGGGDGGGVGAGVEDGEGGREGEGAGVREIDGMSGRNCACGLLVIRESRIVRKRRDRSGSDGDVDVIVGDIWMGIAGSGRRDGGEGGGTLLLVRGGRKGWWMFGVKDVKSC